MDEIKKIQKLVIEYIDQEDAKITMLAKNNLEREIMQALGSVNYRDENSLSSHHFSAISYMLIRKAVADRDPELLLKVGKHAGFKN